mgnify:CR=1 FL=1
MGQKDFTDYNGQKRKGVLRPSPERPILARRKAGKKVLVGFKTKVDRYKSAIASIRFWWERKRRHGKRGFFSRTFWHHDIIRDYVKKLRRLQDQYREEGVLERVLAEAKR